MARVHYTCSPDVGNNNVKSQHYFVRSECLFLTILTTQARQDDGVQAGRRGSLPFLSNKWEKRLRGLFHGLVKRLRRSVAIPSENLVLGTEHPL